MPDHDARLAALGIDLPVPSTPAFNYVPTLRIGNMLYISGQLGLWNGALQQKGRLGIVSLQEAQEAARLCGLNVLAHVRASNGGSLNGIVQCVRLTRYVSTQQDCYDQAAVMNACSDLMEKVLGEAGRHTRTTVGVAALPLDATVEVDGLFQLADERCSSQPWR
ncbi:MAG: RidA family protein [Burkholderiales bacterium]|nr:MAG: RidA family protein [Burkholderiales bacterium]